MAAYASRSKPISAKKMGATINTRSHFEIKWFRRVKITREMGSPSMGRDNGMLFRDNGHAKQTGFRA
jgi:hypothetical protein